MKLTEYLEVQKYKFKREAISKSHPRDLSAPTHTHFPVHPSDKLSIMALCRERSPKAKQVELKGGF